MPEVAPTGSLALLVAAFSLVARGCGLPVPLSAELDYAAALGALGADRPAHTYWAGRACFVHRIEEVAAYDQAYAAFWLGQTPDEQSFAVLAKSASSELDDSSAGEQLPSDGLAYSRAERLGAKDFADLSAAERAEIHELMTRLSTQVARHRTRRWRPARRGRRPDLRRSVARAARTEGTPLAPVWLRRRERPRRVVLLLDVSGSMDPYVAELVRFLHVAVRGRPAVEAFTLGTRLTRLTRHLAARDPDVALREVAASVPDWSGGTRLGESLREFNDRFGIRGLARGAFVVILSDGIDRGDPLLLGAQLARVGRVAHRVVWANPLQATPGYLPTARGMAAAMPHIDTFVPAHSLDALVALARTIAT